MVKLLRVVLSVCRHAWFLLVHMPPQSAFNVTVFYLILLFSLEKSSIVYSKRWSFCFVHAVYLFLVHYVVSITFFNALNIGHLV